MKIRKLNTRGFTHTVLLSVIVILVAVVGTYFIVASHADTCPPVSGSGSSCPVSGPPPIASVGVWATNWQTLRYAAVTNDGPDRKVVQLNIPVAQRVSFVSTSKNSTSTSPVALAKLDAFFQADRGRKVKLCVRARTLSGTSTIQVSVKQAIQNTPLYTVPLSLSNTYTSPCFFFVIDNNYVPNKGSVEISTAPPVYVYKATLIAQ